jgi:hypothetical protein
LGDLGDLLDDVGRGLIDKAEAKGRPAAVAAREIVDFLLEQLGVGHHQSLALDRAKPGCLEADPFDRSDACSVADRVSAAERPVEQDRKAANRSEKMPCAARPMAMPPMPRPAISAVTLTPRLSRMTIIAIAKRRY